MPTSFPKSLIAGRLFIMIKFVAKMILNGLALWVAGTYLDGFSLSGGPAALIIASFVLTLLNTCVRPILKLITFPLIWLSFGLFNIVINMTILWLADQFLTQVTIAGISTLFFASLIISVANIFF